MTRICIEMTPPQLAWLRAQAAWLGISRAELLRRIVDEKRGPAESAMVRTLAVRVARLERRLRDADTPPAP